MIRPQLQSRTLSEIVSDDYRTVAILDRYGLDYSGAGACSLGEACRGKGVDVELVVSEIAALSPDRCEAADQDPVLLVDHIISRHHTYAGSSAPLIRQHLGDVVTRHAVRHPELGAIARQFDTLVDLLRLHILKEEQMLFPYIKALANAVRSDGAPPPDMFGTVQNPIRMMETEHQELSDGLAAIRELSHDYAVPEDACTTYGLVFRELSAFENDLLAHFYLENKVLFPNAMELEGKGRSQAAWTEMSAVEGKASQQIE